MLTMVQDYKLIKNNLSDIIKVSGYRNEFVAEKIGMNKSNFSVKKQRASWTEDEVEKILTIIDNEFVEDYILLSILKNRKDESNVSLAEMKKEFGWK